MMKILVTGALGFIGFHLSLNLLQKGHIVIGLDNVNDYYDQKLKLTRKAILEKNKNFSIFECDLNNINQSLNDYFDIAINLAAQAGVRLPKNEWNKYIHSNSSGFRNFLLYCKKYSIKNIIYASSSSVYSGNTNIPFKEDDTLNEPLSFYASTKLMNETDAEIFSKETGSKIIGLRFFTVYGPFGRPDMAYFDFTKKILNNQQITLFNNGLNSRDMTYVDDVVSGIENAITFINHNNFGHQIFNLGSENPIETLSLVRAIERDFSKKALINFSNDRSEAKTTYADLNKSKEYLGYNPKIKFNEGIKIFFNWFREFYKL